MATEKKKLIRYNLQLRYLAILKDKGKISDEEYKKILSKLQKDYGIVSSFTT